MCWDGSQGWQALGHETIVIGDSQVEKGRESPCILQSRRGMLVAIQEDQAGELSLQ